MFSSAARTATKAATQQTTRSINTSATRKNVAAAGHQFSEQVQHGARRMGASDAAGLLALTAGAIWLGKEALGEVKEYTGPAKK